MGQLKDLTGMTFGRLKVINREGMNKHKKATWLCKCECGNEKIVTGAYLLNGDTKSCGCMQNEENLINKVYGKVRVINKEKDVYTPSGKRNSLWVCECECGNKFATYRQSLIKGYYDDGCTMCKRNTYDLTNEYGIGYTFKGEEFYFDLEDYNEIKKHCWHSSKGYIITKDKTRNVFLHKLIMNTDSIIDHINRKRNDNRKSNLRIATYQENNMNRSKQRNNTSGFIGVSWEKNYKKWSSSIKLNRKRMILGYYSNIEDAIKSRLQAELKYFGIGYAPQRHLFEQYNIT